MRSRSRGTCAARRSGTSRSPRVDSREHPGLHPHARAGPPRRPGLPAGRAADPGRGGAAPGRPGGARCRPGAYAVYETDRPFFWGLRDDWELLVFTWPRESVAIDAAESRRLTARVLDGEDGLGGIVGRMLRELVGRAAGAVARGRDPARRRGRRAGHHRRQRTGRRATPPRRPRTTSLTRIEAYIAEHLGDPDLCPDGIAAAHFLSTRHLHRLFAGSGSTRHQPHPRPAAGALPSRPARPPRPQADHRDRPAVGLRRRGDVQPRVPRRLPGHPEHLPSPLRSLSRAGQPTGGITHAVPRSCKARNDRRPHRCRSEGPGRTFRWPRSAAYARSGLDGSAPR